jgi:hypothetical protein
MAGPVRRTTALALLAIAASAGAAWANGRPPATVGVHTRPGSSQDIYIAATFGLLISHDDGCSFRWVCEQNIGYGGTFDPKYAIARDGTIYATTFDGLRISRDGGCSFTTAMAKGDGDVQLGGVWVDAIDLGPTDDVWIGTAESGGYNDVYHSTDAGKTFVPMGLRSATIWWKSLRVAATDGDRVYVSGYQVAAPSNVILETAPQPRPHGPAAFVYRTDDGGAGWAPQPLDGVITATTPVVLVEAVDPLDADVVYLRSLGANPPNGDRLYRSIDAGATWNEVLVTTEPIRDVVIAQDRRVLVALTSSGILASTDGVVFAPLANQPQAACLAERDDGTLLACGTNWEPDFMSVGRSNDHAMTWNKIFRFSELAGPVQCPGKTAQYEQCELIAWPVLREQFGATPPECAAGTPDAAAPPGNGGCCDATAGGPASGLVTLALCLIGARTGRRRRARAER